MANLTILRTYALKAPEDFPSSILFRSSEKLFTIFDAYPKSIFHLLVLPRLRKDLGLEQRDVANLKALLGANKEKARKVIEDMKEEALHVKREIEEEMVERYGFKWGVWIGFHAVPSMVHLHLHVLSADLVSDRMKNKKHYNSFHPSLGFFLHIDEVLSWFEAEPSFFNSKAQLQPRAYEGLLKEGLGCWKCKSSMKNMPLLKQHLQVEWDTQAAQLKRSAAKRKVNESLQVPDNEQASSSKRSKTEELPGGSEEAA